MIVLPNKTQPRDPCLFTKVYIILFLSGLLDCCRRMPDAHRSTQDRWPARKLAVDLIASATEQLDGWLQFSGLRTTESAERMVHGCRPSQTEGLASLETGRARGGSVQRGFTRSSAPRPPARQFVATQPCAPGLRLRQPRLPCPWPGAATPPTTHRRARPLIPARAPTPAG